MGRSVNQFMRGSCFKGLLAVNCGNGNTDTPSVNERHTAGGWINAPRPNARQSRRSLRPSGLRATMRQSPEKHGVWRLLRMKSRHTSTMA